jgi:glycosyltransferase involved in cell wall biosynthesis
MTPPPLVTVICLCYNHARFVREAIESVLEQTHQNVQLIVVDNGSNDKSVEIIQQVISNRPSIQFIALQKNLGNCKAVNHGLTLAKGDFVIDLSADDVLLPARIEAGVQVLQQEGSEYGVHFSDAELISENGSHLSIHSDRFPHNSIPQGDIYKELISRYFICPPTLMCTRDVMNHLNGYDESLTYEDFDFLIRSSRKFKYAYSPNVLVKRRITENAMGKAQFKFFSKHSRSTFIVCKKILTLNKTKDEKKALTNRIFYEMKLNLRLLNFSIVTKYFFLLLRNSRLMTNNS